MTAPYPPRFFNRSRFRPIVEHIASALRSGTSFSLVRLGDGEGPILCWPDYQWPDSLSESLYTWFGKSDLAESEIDTIATGLRQATRSADVLGISTRYQISKSPRYGMVLQGMEHFHLSSASQILTDSAFHWYLQWSGAYAYLLRGLPLVNVIGCRDIGPQITEAFGIRSVRSYLVRGEHNRDGAEKPHWPEGFSEIMRGLDDIPTGSVFLVAAGGLGKIYCDRIKAKGGIALDIGSILDSWANVPTRKRYDLYPAAFGLDHLKSIGTDWDQMLRALDQGARDFHAADSTLTY
jgi:hypothetical protein